jgi:hypothetical protein
VVLLLFLFHVFFDSICITAQLKKCLPRDVPMHAESILPAVNEGNKAEFLKIVESRKTEMTTAQLSRLKKATKTLAV